MDVRMVDAGGIRLACRVSGNPDGAPVVLLHALGKSGGDWDEAARDLGRGHRIYAPDLRGHGGSDRPGTYSFELMRDDLGALLESLKLERVSLVGHAMGGVVAYLYAAGNPERVERLVLEDVPPPVAYGWEPAEPHGGGEPGFDPGVVAPLAAQLADPAQEWRAGLAAITAPTLLLSGGLRGHVPQERIAEMARAIRSGCLVTIPCGHAIHAARPLEFAATLAGFLPAALGPVTGARTA